LLRLEPVTIERAIERAIQRAIEIQNEIGLDWSCGIVKPVRDKSVIFL
jgi:methionine synthase II (cobalamin-independent)